MRKVNKEEFDKFVAEYPRPLERNVAAMYEPPLCSYNDSTLGEWPESVVAWHHAFTSYDDPTPEGFHILDEKGQDDE
jgi:hypothetical protein